MGSVDIFKRSQEYEAALKDCHYAGEIYLNEKELIQLGKTYSAHKRDLKNKKDLHDALLVVMAANCAYHFYDDRGFWVHFCDLIRAENTSLEKEHLGISIEEGLKNAGLFKRKRKGPFRYVGAVLDQCGVSLKYIRPMARVVRELKYRMGMEYLLTSGFRDYVAIVSDIDCPKYLKNFLMDEGGWRFLIQVCSSIQKYEDGLLTEDDLQKLPKYQPEFWPEFLDTFKPVKVEAISRRLVFKPSLQYYPDGNYIGLRFPSSDYLTGMTKPRGEFKWKYPVTVIDNLDMCSETYEGYVMTEGGGRAYWRIDGWLPDNMPYVFSEKDGLVRRGSTLISGLYFLIVPVDYELSDGGIRRVGELSLGPDNDYAVYHLALDPGETVEGYEAQDRLIKKINLNWVEPDEHRIKFCKSVADVFSGNLPGIEISDYSPIEQNIIGLFYDTGTARGRILNEKDLADFRNIIAELAPVKGRIWLSILARTMSTLQDMDRLDFFVLPECRLRFEEKLYSYDEDAVVSVEGSPDCRINIEDGSRIDDQSRKWIAPRDRVLVNGFLMCRDISIDISLMAWRAAISHPEKGTVRYFTTDDLMEDGEYYLWGRPETDANVCLQGNEDNMIELEFDNSGKALLNSKQLQELKRDNHAMVCEIALTGEDNIANTGAVLVDLDVLKEAVLKERELEIYAPSAPNLAQVTQLLTILIKGADHEINLTGMPDFGHDAINDWVYSHIACASVVDGSRVLVNGAETDWIGLLANNGLRKTLLFIRENIHGEAEIKDTNIDIKYFPELERWRDSLKTILDRGKKPYRLAKVKEWSEEIATKGAPYGSYVARLSGGNLLSTAWEYYLAGDPEQAIKLSRGQGDDAELVSNLKTVLQTMLYLRMARFTAVLEIAERKNVLREFEPILRAAGRLTGSEREAVDTQKKESFRQITDALPLQSEDRLVLMIAMEQDQATVDDSTELSFSHEDWLLLYAQYRIYGNKAQKKKAAETLLEIRDKIPASPEKRRLIEELENYCGRT